MKNTKLLSLILKKTNNLITSDEYKEPYSLGDSFSRNRKLSFLNTVHFSCSALRKSISSEIHDFIEDHAYLKFPSITKQAFSKARQNILSEAFNELCRLFVSKFYSLNRNLNTWNGVNILAVDGTSLQVPDTIECGEYFGLSSLQIEEFSGTKPIAIEQDFYVSIYLSMIAALIKKEADIGIENDNKNKSLKLIYQSNGNFILGQVFKAIISLLVKSKLRIKTLELILEKAIKIRSQIRPNRSCERKKKHSKKHSRKKHHHNIKSCI